MKSIQLFCFFILALAFAGCHQKPEAQKADPNSAVAQESGTVPDSVRVTGGHDYTFLTFKMLIYAASVTMSKDATYQPYAGQWIKLDSDGTFKAGLLSKLTHTGKWTYNHDSGILILLTDNPYVKEFKNSEWKVQFNNDMIVWQGTEKYGDNTTQIKLVRSDKFPEK